MQKTQCFGQNTGYVCKLLRSPGITVVPTATSFDTWESLPDKALLAIKCRMEQGRPFWHWVVFVRNERDAMVLDSKKALKQTPIATSGGSSPSGSFV